MGGRGAVRKFSNEKHLFSFDVVLYITSSILSLTSPWEDAGRYGNSPKKSIFFFDVVIIYIISSVFLPSSWEDARRHRQMKSIFFF